MKDVKIEKMTLNIGTGEPGVKLDNSVLLLQKITGRKPIQTLAKKRIPTWKIRPGLPIGCKVTLRGKEAVELLGRLLESKSKNLDMKNFTDGSLCFGIKEYIEIPGVEYDAKIGIIGFDVAITFMRQGYRIKHRAIKKKTISKKHEIKKEEIVTFMQKTYGVNVL